MYFSLTRDETRSEKNCYLNIESDSVCDDPIVHNVVVIKHQLGILNLEDALLFKQKMNLLCTISTLLNTTNTNWAK